MHKSSRNSRAIRIAVVEPNDADAYWFGLVVKEAQVPIEFVWYPTGVSALNEWIKTGRCVFDLVIVADVLPMLTVREFIDAVRTVQPAVRIIVAGERGWLPTLQMNAVECYAKPLSASEVEAIMHQDVWARTLGGGSSFHQQHLCQPQAISA